MWDNSPKKSTKIKPVENPVWWDDITDGKQKESLEATGWIQKSWDYYQEEGRKKWELANPPDPDPKRWLVGVAMHLFPVFMIFIVLGPANEAFDQMKLLAPQVVEKKMVPFFFTLPLLALLPKYVPESTTLIHYVAAFIGVLSAFRWYYYYFLSESDWLNPLVGNATGYTMPKWAFPACENGMYGNGRNCYTKIYNHTFDDTAYKTHAFCTWDGLAMIVISTFHIVMDGGHLVEAGCIESWQQVAYTLGNIACPEVTYPLFLLQLGSSKREVDAERKASLNMDRNFMLYTAATFLVCLLPFSFSAHNRIVVHKQSADSLMTDVQSNATAFRCFEMIMVIPFSILAYMLPTYGEENEKRAENTPLVWLRKFLIWNASLSHVGAMLAAFLAFRDLDSEEDRVRQELQDEIEFGVKKDD